MVSLSLLNPEGGISINNRDEDPDPAPVIFSTYPDLTCNNKFKLRNFSINFFAFSSVQP